ncbi:hypothetical protein APX70_01557 [Pseudomonas syringae pv. maculicola]|uniref:Uncharacterized protein n=1 Tax=Pseudomonas syringae pv. maculicola TaxID=59511 RepID=A0A3M2TNT8_PSEYM|nr:hypothetical protein APX70_01557 [Pseudomonas syringae pv. maculicola]
MPDDVIQRLNGAATERVGTVAVLTAQWAAGQADKHGGQASRTGFTLQRVKDFGDA